MLSKRLVAYSIAFALVSAAWAGAQSANQKSPAGTDNPPAMVVEPASPGSAALSPAVAQAVVPPLIKFSGTLRDLAGKPISGPVDVTFLLYSEESGGSPLWYETQSVMADALGRYTVLLGAMTPQGVPMELFASGEAHWLGTQVGNLPEQPRVLLVSVPYALKAGDAQTLGGKPASAYQLSGSSSTTNTTLSGLVQASALTSTLGGITPKAITTTQNFIPVFADNTGAVTNSIIVQSGASVGINTPTPAAGLDVNTNIFVVGPKASLPGGAGTMRFRDDTGTVRWLFGIPGVVGSQDFFMFNYSNGHAPLFIQNGAPSYSFYFSAAGNVGLLTNSPSFPLDVNGNVLAVGTKTARSTFGGSLRFRDDTGTPRWALGIPASAGSTDFFVSNLVTAQLPFYIQAAAPSNTLYLNGSGNVGVGTAAPAQKLTVAGNLKITGTGNALIFPDGTVMTSAGAGTNGGTITGVTAGTGLSGGGTAGSVTLSLASASCTAGKAVTALPLACQSFAGLGANSYTGDQTVTGNVGASGTVTGSQLVSTVATGTAPLSVASTTQVPNLNASLLGGLSASSFAGVNGNSYTGNQTVTGNVSASGTVTGSQLISSVATGTPPLSVASTTQVPNLNASLLGGQSASSFAGLGANAFVGDQTITGNISASGSLTASTASVTGALSSGQASFAASNGSQVVSISQSGIGTALTTVAPNASIGIFASANTTSGVGIEGSIGVALLAPSHTAGVLGVNNATNGYGVQGIASNATGIAGLFNNTVSGGQILSGQANGSEVFAVSYAGGVKARTLLPAVNTVAFSSTPAFDASLGNTQEMTLTNNVTSFTITNPTAGQTLRFIWIQDATGGRTISGAPANMKGFSSPGGTANSYSIQACTYDGTNWVCEAANVNL